jgi:hypothetical protein
MSQGTAGEGAGVPPADGSGLGLASAGDEAGDDPDGADDAAQLWRVARCVATVLAMSESGEISITLFHSAVVRSMSGGFWLKYMKPRS